MKAGPPPMRSPELTYEGVRNVIQRKYPAYDVEIREGEYYIVSPHDMISSNIIMRLGHTRRKLETLLAKGVDVGVYIDPGGRVVEIHRAGGAPLIVAPGGRFEVPDILPGFGFIVDELWPE